MDDITIEASVSELRSILMRLSDILPIGLSLGAWSAQQVLEDDYFTPSRQADTAKEIV